MMHSVGIDLHRSRSHVAVIDDRGDVLLSRRIINDPETFLALLAEIDGECRVALEATYGWEWLADVLQDAGYELHLAHPLRTKAIASARVKTDAVDARTLAHLLRTDLLPEAYVAPRELRDLRDLLRHRVVLTRMRSALKNRVHALLARQGIQREHADLFGDRKSTRLNSSHSQISYAVFCLKKKKKHHSEPPPHRTHLRPPPRPILIATPRHQVLESSTPNPALFALYDTNGSMVCSPSPSLY